MVYAIESPRIQKIRLRVEEHYKQIERGISDQAVKRTASQIYRRLAENSTRSVGKKSIIEFDENQNPADLSKIAKFVMEKLRG
ncbi:MAG: hypothetical protein K1060chlam2_00322 [Chlamydiae bacterium]|nr:hypothetical protein [Chlamydiota bacterium]